MALTGSLTSLQSAVCFTLLMLLSVSSNSVISSISEEVASWNHALLFANRLQPLGSVGGFLAPIIVPSEQGLLRPFLEQKDGGTSLLETATSLPKLKLCLSANNSRTLCLLSTVEDLSDKTKGVSGDFVELGSLAPPAIISQAVWRASGQQRKSVLIAGGSTLSNNNETSQRDMFRTAGVMDSSIFIVDDLLGAVRQHVGAIAMLFLNEYLLENTVFYYLYDRVPMGGYVLIDDWRDDLFVNSIPGIVLIADGTVAYWEKTKASEELFLKNRASLINKRRTGVEN
jgi:hypothetical protein